MRRLFLTLTILIINLYLIGGAFLFTVHAATGVFKIIPCDGVTQPDIQKNIDANNGVGKSGYAQDASLYEESEGGSNDKKVACTLPAFVKLITNVINVLFILSVPITMIALTWVGILLLTAQGNTGKVTQAKEILWKVMIGFIFILSAWIIIHTIATVFLQDAYNRYVK